MTSPIPEHVLRFWRSLDAMFGRVEPTRWGAVVTDRRYPAVWDANYARVDTDSAGLTLAEVEASLLPALSHGQLLGSEKWPVKRVMPPLIDHLAADGHDPTSVTIVDDCEDLFVSGSEHEQATFASDVMALSAAW